MLKNYSDNYWDRYSVCVIKELINHFGDTYLLFISQCINYYFDDIAFKVPVVLIKILCKFIRN